MTSTKENARTGQGQGVKKYSKGNSHRNRSGNGTPASWQRYELLKQKYTANAQSSSEYDAGIRRAVLESGV